MIDTIGIGLACFLAGVVITNLYWIPKWGRACREAIQALGATSPLRDNAPQVRTFTTKGPVE